jgi:hypothetical protein
MCIVYYYQSYIGNVGLQRVVVSHLYQILVTRVLLSSCLSYYCLVVLLNQTGPHVHSISFELLRRMARSEITWIPHFRRF